MSPLSKLPPFSLAEIEAMGPAWRDLAIEILWQAVREMQGRDTALDGGDEHDDK